MTLGTCHVRGDGELHTTATIELHIHYKGFTGSVGEFWIPMSLPGIL